MSGFATGWVLKYADVQSHIELAFLVVIADASHDDGTGCCESIATMAALARISESTAHNVVRELDRRDLIHVERGGGRGHPNRYAILIRNDHAETLADIKGPAKRPFVGLKGVERVQKGSDGHAQIAADPDPDPLPKAFVSSAPANSYQGTGTTGQEESPFRRFWERFRVISNGHPGDIQAAGTMWNKVVPPDAIPRLFQYLEVYAGSREVLSGRVMAAEKWLAQWNQWETDRAPTTERRERQPRNESAPGRVVHDQNSDFVRRVNELARR